MAHLVYYVSVGKAHMKRCALILEALLHSHDEIHVTIVYCEGIRYLRRRLSRFKNKIHYRQLPIALNYIFYSNELRVNVMQTQEQLLAYKDDWEKLIAHERHYLMTNEAHFVFSDIEPVAFPAAQQAGVRSAGMGHFTWYTLMMEWFPEESLFLKQAYEQMDQWIALAGHKEPNWGNVGSCTLDWFTGEINIKRVRRMRKKWLQQTGNDRVAFVGLEKDLGNIRLPQTWSNEKTVIVVSSGSVTGNTNVVPIPTFERFPQEFMAACDLAIMRPSWDTIAEAAVTGKPIRVAVQHKLPEERGLREAVKHFGLGETVIIDSTQDIFDLPLKLPVRAGVTATNQLPRVLTLLRYWLFHQPSTGIKTL
ncbi:hypothetical protein G4V62_11890 [Bacillaceae bacterium SIJ1]|uniref:hypothetical protein n=1 Tax=Litoribacterium kuwaitense TaxID=1398745 RepID=UPI0013ED6981|nr:hypothetical protein [Litoribacterium kuwaitense]NGP45622.1 hypothetical protein [Litoribacterium kuwaitense]